MKKVLIVIGVLILVGFGGYFIYVNYFDVKKVIPEEEKVSVSDYYMYGNHLNIKGILEIEDMNYTNAVLSLYGKEEKEIPIEESNDGTKIEFYLSKYINDGLYIDDLERGIYYLFLKLTYEGENDKDNDIVKYYALNNETDYEKAEYYTLSKYNNEITIDSNNDYQTMAFTVKENKNKNIYDVTIDPGHGGMDGGGSNGNYKESDYTMKISKEVEKNLVDAGIKVMLTHDTNELSSGDVLDEYGTHGRAVIPNEVKSKYTISIHVNKNTSSRVSGFEIYTPVNINYDFAKKIASNLEEYTDIDPSSNRLYKMFNGIYSRNFTEGDVASSLKDYENKGYKPYNVSTNSNYYYMIRETGGYMTGAYIDESNPDKVGVNPYYNSNVANESYLLELGYLSNASDLDVIVNNYQDIAKAVSDAIIEELNK